MATAGLRRKLAPIPAALLTSRARDELYNRNRPTGLLTSVRPGRRFYWLGRQQINNTSLPVVNNAPPARGAGLTRCRALITLTRLIKDGPRTYEICRCRRRCAE